MIDLHLHTTASDGRCTPGELVERVAAAGIETFAVADHDTVAAVPEATRLAGARNLRCVPGIEITAVYRGKDIHMLGYFLDVESPALLEFLANSRADRVRRARLMADKLAELGAPIDIDPLIAAAEGRGAAIARPVIARALVEAGHVADVSEAFDRFLAEDKPAYFPRIGASPAEVVGIIHDAGGLAAIAHPGTHGRDELVPDLAAVGLDALEVYHSEHTPEQVAHYGELARRHGLAVTGGSDFHGDGTRRAEHFGRVSLPAEAFARLEAIAAAKGRG